MIKPIELTCFDPSRSHFASKTSSWLSLLIWLWYGQAQVLRLFDSTELQVHRATPLKSQAIIGNPPSTCALLGLAILLSCPLVSTGS